jgi:hypothetical protein
MIVHPGRLLNGANLAVSAHLVLESWNPSTGSGISGTYDYGETNDNYLYTTPSLPGGRTGIYYGGSVNNIVGVATGNSPGTSEVVAPVPGVRFTMSPGGGGWFKLWVQLKWYFAGGQEASEVWVEYHSAGSYQVFGGSTTDPAGWCYVIPN